MSDVNNTMDNKHFQALTQEEMHSLVDSQLSPQKRAILQDRLGQDAPAKASIAQWQLQRNALRSLHQNVLDEPLPDSLLKAMQQVSTAQQDLKNWWRWGGMAAGVLLAFGVGWFSSTAWRGEWQTGSPYPALAKGPAVQDFVRQASYAHVVYAPEVRHPVEVTAADQVHLVQWLSKRLGRPLKVPNLTDHGFDLVGGRLLPGDAGARAQFMFQNVSGTRITLYLGAVNNSTAGTDPRETGFQFATDGTVANFYWFDQGFGYALTGPVPRAELMQLVQAVYHQL